MKQDEQSFCVTISRRKKDGAQSIISYMVPGADPGLILGCCKILQKEIENRNDITMQKNYRFSKKQEGMVLITVGVQI